MTPNTERKLGSPVCQRQRCQRRRAAVTQAVSQSRAYVKAFPPVFVDGLSTLSPLDQTSHFTCGNSFFCLYLVLLAACQHQSTTPGHQQLPPRADIDSQQSAHNKICSFSIVVWPAVARGLRNTGVFTPCPRVFTSRHVHQDVWLDAVGQGVRLPPSPDIFGQRKWSEAAIYYIYTYIRV